MQAPLPREAKSSTAPQSWLWGKLLGHGAVYAAGQLVTRLASIVLLPVYTRFLTPADYGCMAVLDLVATLIGICIASGLGAAATRYHFEARSEAERVEVWCTALVTVVVFSCAIVVGLWPLRDALANVTLGNLGGIGASYYAYALVTLWLVALGEVPDQYFRVRKQSLLLVGLHLSTLALNIVINLVLLFWLQWGLRGILCGNLLASVVTSTVRVVIFRRAFPSFRFAPRRLPRLWQFGLPIAAGALLSTMMHQADRYLLRLYVDLNAVGVYSLAYVVGQGASALLMGPYSAIWSVVVYEVAARRDAPAIYAAAFHAFFAVLALALFAVALFAGPLLSLLAPASYAGARDLVPVVCLAYLFYALHEHFKTPALVHKRTLSMLAVYVRGAAVNLAANLILIPLFGALGAAWASVLGFAAFSFGGLRVYARIERYPYALRRCLSCVLGMVLTALVCRWAAPASTSLGIGVAAAVWVFWAIVLLRSLEIANPFAVRGSG